MREFTFISCFVCHPDTASILQAIRTLCEAEGMTSSPTPPAKAFHHAPALRNNRWQIEVLVGESGWHFLLTTPWNLLAQRAEGAYACRLVQLAHMLKTGAFLLCKYDDYPAEHGEVLLETNGPQGYTFVTGHWATTAPEIPVKEGTTEIDYEAEVDWDGDADFYGTPLRERGGRVKAQSRLLQKLWDEHNEVDWSNPENDDLRADDSNELLQRYLIKRLLGLPPYKVMYSPDSWPADRRHTLWLEWPDGDRPET